MSHSLIQFAVYEKRRWNKRKVSEFRSKRTVVQLFNSCPIQLSLYAKDEKSCEKSWRPGSFQSWQWVTFYDPWPTRLTWPTQICWPIWLIVGSGSFVKAVVTTTIWLRLDRRSTPIRLQFDSATTFDDLRYDRRPACVWAAALWPK